MKTIEYLKTHHKSFLLCQFLFLCSTKLSTSKIGQIINLNFQVKIWPYLVNADIIKLLWFFRKAKFLSVFIPSWSKVFNYCNYFLYFIAYNTHFIVLKFLKTSNRALSYFLDYEISCSAKTRLVFQTNSTSFCSVEIYLFNDLYCIAINWNQSYSREIWEKWCSMFQNLIDTL